MAWGIMPCIMISYGLALCQPNSDMKTINVNKITSAIESLYINSSIDLPKDVVKKLSASISKETSARAKNSLKVLIDNICIAGKKRIPVCQDTGLAIVFIEIGQDVKITGGNLNDAINEGIRRAVKKAYLRASVVHHPFDRKNTNDNTPAIIHTEIVPGNKIKMQLMAKGAGSENMSALKMLKPSDGIEGIKAFVMETVKAAGPNPCPPMIVGVGVGGNFEKVAYIAKKHCLGI